MYVGKMLVLNFYIIDSKVYNCLIGLDIFLKRGFYTTKISQRNAIYNKIRENREIKRLFTT